MKGKEEMQEKLKLCPFCAGKVRIETCNCDEFSLWKVTCGNPICPCYNSLWYMTEENAVTAWNNRPLYEKLTRENKILLDALDEIVNKNDFSRYVDGSLFDTVVAKYDIRIDGIPLVKIAQRALKEVNRK